MNYEKGETSSVAVVVIAIVAILAIGFLVMFFMQQMGANKPSIDGTKIEVQLPTPTPAPAAEPTN